jgi:hypothetical protein
MTGAFFAGSLKHPETALGGDRKSAGSSRRSGDLKGDRFTKATPLQAAAAVCIAKAGAAGPGLGRSSRGAARHRGDASHHHIAAVARGHPVIDIRPGRGAGPAPPVVSAGCAAAPQLPDLPASSGLAIGREAGGRGTSWRRYCRVRRGQKLWISPY